MKKIILFVGITILLMFSVAQATVYPSFTFNLDLGNAALIEQGTVAPYATVQIDLTSETTATVSFTSDYIMFDTGMIMLNVNSSSPFGVSLPPILTHNGEEYPRIDTGNPSDFGNFNLILKNFDGPNDGVSSYYFYLTAGSGSSWASASDVLTANEDGHLAAVHIYDEDATCPAGSQNCTSSLSGFATNKVPEPTSMLLLGSGLLGLALYSRRKFRK
jgi:hypothetical protein